MANYAVPGSHSAVSSSYKTAALVNAATTGSLRRGKIWEVMIGVAGNPNATDTYIQWDISRITASGAGAYTSWTPTSLDPADAASLTLAGITATAEATTFTANSSIWNEAINQRGSLRWVAPQESQSLIWPATNSAGFSLRGLSTTYTGATTGQLTFQE